MGYTHYFERSDEDISRATWQKICKDVALLIAAGPAVCWEDDLPTRPPEVSTALIRFNGPGKEGHETFYFLRVPDDTWFCKTERKPYDKTVCAVLAVIHDLAPASAAIRSDGFVEEWQPAVTWASALVGRPLAVPPLVRPAASYAAE